MFRFSAFLLAAALGLTGPAFAQEREAAAPEGQPQMRLPAINVTEVIETALGDHVIASGAFQPAETVFVQPEIEGQATEELLADVGDTVEAGQVLARLSGSALTLQRSQLLASRAAAEAAIAQARAQVAEVRAARDEAVRTAERTKSLRAQGAVAQAALDQAQAQADTAEARVNAAIQGVAAAEAQIGLIDAQLEDLDLKLSRTNITAPVAGVIVERNARIGAIASAGGGSPMFTLIRDGKLELYADVSGQDVLRIKPGQSATLSVVGRPDPVLGTVRLVEPSIDSVTRLGRVRISLEDSSLVLDGMFAEADILVTERTGFAAPITAVAADNTVQLVEDGTVRKTPVKTGIRDGNLVEILEGVKTGDRVVSRAGAFVRDGDRINPVLAKTPVASN